MIRRVISNVLRRREPIVNNYNVSDIRKLWWSSSPIKLEAEIKTILNTKFPDAKLIQVEDVSGGCGAMFDITVQDQSFKDLSIVKQHQIVTGLLKDQIKQIHGLRIVTSVPCLAQ